MRRYLWLLLLIFVVGSVAADPLPVPPPKWNNVGNRDTLQAQGTADVILKITRDATNDTTRLFTPVGVLIVGPEGLTTGDSLMLFSYLSMVFSGDTNQVTPVLLDSIVDGLGRFGGRFDSLFVGAGPILLPGSGDTAVFNAATASPGNLWTGEADAHFGDSTAGAGEFGKAWFGMHADAKLNNDSLDVDQVLFIMNKGAPTGEFEMIFTESNGGNAIREAWPSSGAGKGTWHTRSGFFAGPSRYWDSCAFGYVWGFDSLDMTTDVDGADLGVQNDMQILGELFLDSIRSAGQTELNIDQDLGVQGDIAVTGTVDGVDLSAIPAVNVKMDTIGATTFTTVQDIQDVFHSTGWVSGGGLTDTTGGGAGDSVYVAAGTGLIRASDNDTSTLSFCDWGDTTVLMKTDSVHYIGIEYNAGSPRVFATGDYTDFNFQTNFDIATVVNEGDVLHIEISQHTVGDHANNMIRRVDDVAGIQRDNRTGGLILGETGTRYITVTAGNLWDKLNLFAIAAINTTPAGDDFDRYYRDGSGGWTKQAAQTQWNNTQWDDGDGGLATHASNKYGVEWFYLEPDNGGELVSLFGRATHNSAAIAETEATPSTLPPRIEQHGILIGRIIFKESAATAIEIQTVFSAVFPATQATDHGNLAGLADDDHTQYLLEADANVDTTGWNAATDSVGVWDNRGYPTASTTALGIASFDNTNFSTLGGDVSIASGGVNSGNIANNSIDTTDIDKAKFGKFVRDTVAAGITMSGTIDVGNDSITNANVIRTDSLAVGADTVGDITGNGLEVDGVVLQTDTSVLATLNALNDSTNNHNHDSVWVNNLNVQGDITVTGNIINNGWRHDLDTANAWMTRADSHLILPITLHSSDADSSHLADSSVAWHPSILYFPDGKWGFRYWLAYTAIIGGSTDSENPHIAVSNDGVTWELFNSNPGGSGDTLYNPLYGVSTGSNASVDSLVDALHLSDPDLFELHSGGLGMAFRANYGIFGSDSVVIKVVTTTNGTTWTKANDSTATVIAWDASTSLHPNLSCLTPAVVLDTNKTYSIFAGMTDTIVGATNDTTLLFKWSSAYPDSGYVFVDTAIWSATGSDSTQWHFDIIPVGADFMVMTSFQQPLEVNGASGVNKLLVSNNRGLTWTPKTATILAGSGITGDFDSAITYGTSPYLIEEGDELAIGVFYSGRGRHAGELFAIGEGRIRLSDSTTITPLTSFEEYQWIYLDLPHTWPRATSDSIYATPPVQTSTSSFLLKWYSTDLQTANVDDTLGYSGYVPFDCVIDSLEFRYQSAQTDTRIDSVNFRGPNLTSGGEMTDSSYWVNTTALTLSAWTTQGYTFSSDVTASAGNRFLFQTFANFAAATDTINVGWVRIRVKR